MVFVIPSFKSVFASFGANLPWLTLMVIAISDFFVKWWWAIFMIMVGVVHRRCAWRSSGRRRCATSCTSTR